MRLRVWCPAKVNLFLSVGPKDGIGYHPVVTVLQAVGLFDELEIETGVGETSIESDWSDLPGENTLTKTLRLLREIVDVPPIRVRLTKRIPSQSGLGGGSSDAAGLLRAVRALTRKAPSEAEFHSVAAAVGVDVPFFLVGGRAIGTGYGDRIEPRPDAQREWLLLAKPEANGSTVEMYRKLDDKSYEWRQSPSEEFYNDFERVARCESLELIEAIRASGAKDAGLSGSGSAVFGRFDSEEAAKRAQDRLAQPGTQTWVVPTLSRAESLRLETL